MKGKTTPSAQEIANIAGVSLTLVHRKLSQGKSPKQIIAEAAAQEERVAQRHPKVNVADIGGLNGHAATFAQAQTRKEFALAGLRETELAERTGELMPVEQAQQWLQHIFVPLVQGFRALPAELRDLLTPGVADLLARRTEGLIRSADLYLENCFQRGGQPMSDGSLNCGDGWKVEWKIIPPPVEPVKQEVA